MFDSVRARLTLWYTAVLALVLIIFAVSAYFFLSRTLERRTDDSLAEMARAFVETISTEQQEMQLNATRAVAPNAQGQIQPFNVDAAVIEAASEYRLRDYQFVIYDESRRIIATSSTINVEQKVTKEPVWTSPPYLSGLTRLLDALSGKPEGTHLYATLSDGDDELRALARTLRTLDRSYTLVVIRPFDEQEDIIEGAGRSLLVGVPLALALASVGGYFLARKSLAPVVVMSETAERIGAANLQERLPIINERDELGRLAGVFNKLLARLDESFDQQRRFMADASHELRTPVAIVRGEAEVSLSRKERDAEDYRESIAIVHDEGRRLTHIVEDLFTLARADAGQNPLNAADFYLDEVVAECVLAMRTLAAGRGVSLDSDAPHEMPFHGDEELIRRMLLNLLDNAIKYTPAGGRVSVKCETQGKEYVLTVSDTGAGIPAEAQSQIFQRFYRADKARSRNESTNGYGATTSGAGLGLSIARLVAEAHKGSLELLRSDERGSVFVATLPSPDLNRE
jgi:two-component system, OmpR family, sensor kinase